MEDEIGAKLALHQGLSEFKVEGRTLHLRSWRGLYKSGNEFVEFKENIDSLPASVDGW
jgi:hypothetical protein